MSSLDHASCVFFIFMSFLIFTTHYLPFSHLLCCSCATFPGMVWAVVVVVAVMSKPFPMQPHRRVFVSPPGFGGPHGRAVPHSTDSTMGLYAAKPPSPTSLHHASLLRGTERHRGHHGIKTPTLFMPCPVPLSLVHANRVRYSE